MRKAPGQVGVGIVRIEPDDSVHNDDLPVMLVRGIAVRLWLTEFPQQLQDPFGFFGRPQMTGSARVASVLGAITDLERDLRGGYQVRQILWIQFQRRLVGGQSLGRSSPSTNTRLPECCDIESQAARILA